MSAQRPREIALRLLRRWETDSAFADALLSEALPSVVPRDRALCQELFYGVLRWRAPLDWLIDQRTAGRKQAPLVRDLLRLGLYQIFWLDRVPDHAAVHETVALARVCDVGHAAGFINATLRGCLRERDQWRAALDRLPTEHLALGHSHPDWLVARWLARWGEADTLALLRWNNQPPPIYARPNPLCTTDLAARWLAAGVPHEAVSFDWMDAPMLRLATEGSPDKLPGFAEGHFYLQDPSTLLAVQMLDPQPEDEILDLCAAPGGKACAIAARINNVGHIIACDVDKDRLALLRENAQRLGARSVDPLSVAHLPPRAVFDRVLVDAPCSNTGVMRRRVDLRWRLQPRSLTQACGAQRDLLARAADHVKAGGRLVYSTCSVEEEENAAQIAAFLAAHPKFALEAERVLLPFRDRVDGTYVARLRRS